MSSLQTHMSGYGMKQLSELTGLSRHVLRKWEQRYTFLSPRRTANGYRVYDLEDLQLLLFLNYQLTTGLSVGRLARQGRAALLAEMNAGPIDVHHVAQDSQPQARDLIQAARRGDQAAVDRTIALIIHQRGFDEALTDVFFPVLQTIGEIWHQGRISITGEQAVSRTIQRLLVHAHQPHRPNRPYALIACVPNDFHEIGAMSAARFLRTNGWNTTYLGPDVNVDVVRLACRRRHGKLVLFSCAVEPPSSDMKTLIDDIVRQLLPLTQVVVGGRGADVYRDWLERRGIRYIVEINRVKAITPRLLGRSTRLRHATAVTSEKREP